MGLLDFVKSAGESIFGKDDDEKSAPQAPSGGPSAEDVARMKNRRKAAGLVQLVQGLGFEVEDMTVKVEGDVATVGGKVGSQETREKILLAIGNTA
ncbi:MAG: peptidoglycan-binding protein LysM, partial [Acidobacteriota bacterium]|nr:peptidoglycan-binding protein LysM [Acidobacteriota bacterium]